MPFVVYKHTSPNGKVYIGITSRDPKVRWDYGYGYKANEHFYRAIQKHGWSNFEHEILYENLTKEEACKKEIELIAEYKSDNEQYGYNILKGGNLGRIGIPHSEETKKKISQSRMGANNPAYGKHHTEEWKQMMREKMTGRKFSEESIQRMRDAQKGRTISEEHRKKLSKANLGKRYKHTPETIERMRRSKYKRVYCPETNKVYESIKQAEKETGAPNPSITAVCKGRHKTAKGYHFQYAD